ncbi:hypothetical protein ACV07N_04225 [Roseivirga echinicomitans]
MTAKEEKIISAFMKDHRLLFEELYAEFYDHIVSSFEARADKNQDINAHLKQVLKDFGGEDGMKKIVWARQKAYARAYRKIVFNHFRTYFRWPLLFTTLLIGILVFQLTQVFQPYWVIFYTLLITTGYGFFFGVRDMILYRRSCKTLKLPYKSSLKNEAIGPPFLLGSLLINLFNGLNTKKSITEHFDTHGILITAVAVTVATLYMVYFLASEKAYKSEYKLKVELI